MKTKRLFIILLLLIFFTNYTYCQNSKTNSAGFIRVEAGKEYKRSQWHQFLWGHNYRKEWTTPVLVPVFMLDTAKGGLITEKAGGGHQTKSLHVKTANGKEYALRSVDKTLSKVLPENIQHSFLEKQVNDEVSMSHPYGAAAVPFMEQAAGIYHTWPQYVYLLKQKTLDSFNNDFGNNLYLFEQRLDGNWKDADNLGNFNKFYATEDVLKEMKDDNNNVADQKTFVKDRLFDMFINDWDRHEDQWMWGKVDNNGETLFVPVPQDRDQAFFKHDGLLLNFGLSAGGLNYMQSFDDHLHNVKTFNFEERNLDRFFSNELTLNDWQTIAKNLQRLLTDNVIETSVKKLPPAIFAISGNEIISKLKSRRDKLVDMASTYYLFLAKDVEITGSEKAEHFDVNRMNNGETKVSIYDINKYGKDKSHPFYERTFQPNETKEIRLFGIKGDDTYTIKGNANNAIRVRIIGSKDNDSVTNTSGKKVVVYDYAKTLDDNHKNLNVHLYTDSSMPSFKYNWFKYNKSGFVPSVFYSNEDKIYVGLGYQFLHNNWIKKPFASKQLFDVHYSFTDKGFSYTYTALFKQLLGKWDLSMYANYDVIRWKYFFGLGNETQFIPHDIHYFTTRTREWIFRPALIRNSGFNTFTFSPFVQGVKVIDDTSKFIHQTFTNRYPQNYNWTTFGGADIAYKYQNINDSAAPDKGFIFAADVLGVNNFTNSSNSFIKYSGSVQLYVPLVSKFSLDLRAGASTVQGTPEFYQYASIGGPTLRGYRLDRFYGKSSFYNTNDLRYLSKVKLGILNGKAGLLVFFDDGRVWMPNETSDVFHTSYGGGIILVPFNKIMGDVTYGISKEEKLFQVRITKYF